MSTFPVGTRVRKVSGSSWQGHVVGHYRTSLTPDGVCVESEREPGSVQIYPARALVEITVDRDRVRTTIDVCVTDVTAEPLEPECPF